MFLQQFQVTPENKEQGMYELQAFQSIFWAWAINPPCKEVFQI